ncbi:MAG: Ubiquinone biosynthesis protein coq9, mitochondrial [Ramalina farinacea]|uniref:Ubiquinone biosynthesis protein n=1 Tax=Ramalina farinacea TaxID=258253 RepID=A0AA43TNA0_9LECA|nr:Ubiquinone biosynthesis protein coq9, mitochondrial [Ramalina farinacea]
MARAFAPFALTCLRQRSRQPCLSILSARQYHSHEHASSSPFSPTEDAILSAALKYVLSSSFTAESLSLGAQDAGYLPISTNLFPSGAFALVNYHLVTQRLRLSDSFSRPDPSPQLNISDNVRSIAMQRLKGTAPYIPQWQDALALLSMRSNIPTGVRELARLADEILYLAGSDTVTTAWYTDRMALAGIYASAELFMTQDRSRGFADTEDFLHRRLQEGEKLRDAGSMVGKWVGMQAGGLIDGLRSKGVWI